MLIVNSLVYRGANPVEAEMEGMLEGRCLRTAWLVCRGTGCPNVGDPDS